MGKMAAKDIEQLETNMVNLVKQIKGHQYLFFVIVPLFYLGLAIRNPSNFWTQNSFPQYLILLEMDVDVNPDMLVIGVVGAQGDVRRRGRHH